MHDLTAFQRDLLYVIAGMDEPKGLAVRDDLQKYYGTEINNGRRYPNLDELVEANLVKKGEIDKRTNYYRLSQRGQQLLAARRDWEDQTADLSLHPV
jgi:DNA-binding PadR family transcriptional regulator